ncbi:hypothetical protein HAX54_041768 [Datura stramonium]|uniref:Uncharacterized protein n=1 Tax=Datura stramonium TaxID=4076 RepID=A0ABS8VYD5_DATST|nr:hypothetical protein [Datura stramonium]
MLAVSRDDILLCALNLSVQRKTSASRSLNIMLPGNLNHHHINVERPVDSTDEEDDVTVADVAAPYWQRPVGPTWWFHVAAGHPSVNAWLSNACGCILP